MLAFILYLAALILFIIAAVGRGPAWAIAAGLACVAGAGALERWPG